MSAQCEVGLAQIVQFLTGQMGLSQQEQLQKHLDSGCEQCNERLSTLTEFDDTPEEPQQDQLLAQPLFDTELQPSPMNVRGQATLIRRRLYEAENRICLDIEQVVIKPGLVTLQGQVLVRGGGMDEVVDATVSLINSDAVARETSVDEFGDFEIPDVPSATYDLRVTTGNMEVIVRGIQI
ncbi:MAG: carboxypeptidase-like regulatory domain-containing protein [SAR202 cluster bacterium]|nr:carboxypeptidase-like regulatory domain-containing protein [SAR202 cluster bacterium]MDP6715692.1 carboxypeptidase-like regulatory domain-containing protein [SAR202 cluster bacterium]